MIWKCQQHLGSLFCCITFASPVMNMTLRPITSQLEFITINRYKPTVDQVPIHLLSVCEIFSSHLCCISWITVRYSPKEKQRELTAFSCVLWPTYSCHSCLSCFYFAQSAPLSPPPATSHFPQANAFLRNFPDLPFSTCPPDALGRSRRP